MEPRKVVKQVSKAPEVRKKEPKARLQIVKLEERIAPGHHHHLHHIGQGMQLQHNETLVREPARAKPKASKIRRKEPKPKLQIVKLEQRIAPKLATNHNETLVREPARAKPKASDVRKEEPRPKLQIVKLEERIAPGIQMQHNETLVRYRSPHAR
jgi:hypothetical protein